MTIQARRVSFPSAHSDETILEGILTLPSSGDDAPAVVLCHGIAPSGSMDDTILTECESACLSIGCATLRFNFREVGAHFADSTPGATRLPDLAGALTYVLNQAGVHPAHAYVVGQGFGASVALQLASTEARIAALMAISPPLYRLKADPPRVSCPTLLLAGELDEVCPPDTLRELAPQIAEGSKVAIIPGALHSMRGREGEVAALAIAYLELQIAAGFGESNSAS